ncbi:putative copper resistance protein D [Amycolatopsis arida]|uniref:Putative copper resistance protein D n=1 Tax=Amycolatopsis arida TaxID=587909 RepID=A0A1I5M775_9PSEU|nr:putative copper resistance protein D [Amycolatopsis arida]SFP05498.1 putative copper resistance protein D [Amycolatopsis arida]
MAALGLAIAGLTAAFLTVAVVLRLGGGASAGQLPGLPGPGPVTPWALPATRVLGDVAAVATVGLLLAAAVLGPIPRRSSDQPARTVGPHAYRWTRAAGWTALVWFTATVLGAGYTVSDILGRPLGEVVGDPRVLGSGLGLPPVPGLLVVAGLVAVLAVACRAVLSRAGVVVLLALALAATLPPAFGGHSGGGSGDHRMAISAMLMHIVGVVLWTGGLLALTLAHRLPTADLDRAARRYSRLAGWCLAAVGLSGLLNVLARLDPLSGLWQSPYGWLVLAKVGAFGVLAAVGGLHRLRTLPALRRGRRAAFAQLATVELVIVAASIGLAVGLSRTPTPAGESAGGAHGPADVGGVAMPEAPGVRSLLLTGRPEPVFLTIATVAVLLYLAGVRRLRRDGETWPLTSSASWVTGWLLIAWVIGGGLARYAEVLFSAGLVQHLALALPAPLLLVAGRPVTLARRALTPATDPRWPGPREWLRDLLGSRPLRVLVRPPVALTVQGVLAFVVHFAGLHETAWRSDAGYLATAGLVLMTGYAFWWGVLGIDAAPHRPTPWARAITLGAMVALLDVLGVALLRAHTDIGGYGDTGPSRPWGRGVLGDQVLAGEITLWAAGSASVLIAGTALVTSWRASRTGRRSEPPPVTAGCAAPVAETRSGR